MASITVKTCFQIAIALLFASGFAAILLHDVGNVSASIGSGQAAPTPAKRKYSEFPHNAKAHQIECASCHKFPSKNWEEVRSAGEAFEDITEYPTHDSCVKCHTQQFFRGSQPVICSICHTNPSPRNSTRHPFPNPREIFDNSPKGKAAQSDFDITFPHDKHIEIVSASNRRGVNWIVASHRPRREEESCAVCHQTQAPQGNSDVEFITPPPATIGDGFWLRKGTFKTAPLGHKTCFTCHSADSGMTPEPKNCASCHKLGSPQPAADLDPKLLLASKLTDKSMIDSWRKRDSSGTFRHEFVAHTELSCSTCHNVAAMNTADAKTKRVGIESCAMCHVTATSDEGGALNYEIDQRKAKATFQCTKCHLAFGSKAIPESHTKAVTPSK